MVWLAFLLPLLGALLTGLGSRSLGRSAASAVACAAAAGAFLASLATASEVASRGAHTARLWRWLTAGGIPVEVQALADPLSVTMLGVVTGVGFLIFWYSAGYMGEERDLGRYFTYLNLFLAAMVLLVIADNLALLLVGWGGVGFASYALIGFWYDRPAAVLAARKAFVINLVGDVALLLAIFLLAVEAGSLAYGRVLAVETLPSAGWIAALLLVAACAKSAQIPLHTWLPDAMEGPTPVSALIHAATMVTAGVYLVVRCHPLFEMAPAVQLAVALIGGAGAFLAASAALAQNDLKRVLAYSTMSQVGYMFLAAGMGAYAAALFHLVTHAFFKALLFLSAGLVIHALGGEQDMRRMGGLRCRLPLAYWTFAVATLAISGIPPLSGYFSKDRVLESAWGGPIALWLLGLAAAFLTALYMFRALLLTFHGSSARDPGELHPPGLSMQGPVVVLTVLTVMGGILNLPDSQLLGHYLAEVVGPPHHPAAPPLVAFLPVLLGLAGWGLALLLVRSGALPGALGLLLPVLQAGWGFDRLYDRSVRQPLHLLAEAFADPVEGGLSRDLPEALGSSVAEAGESLAGFQTGQLRLYAAALLLGVALVLGYALLVLVKGG